MRLLEEIMRLLHSLQLIPSIMLGLYATACFAGGTSKSPKSEPKSNLKINWTYDADKTGQEDWGSLPRSELCELGTNQSPINIAGTKIVAISPLEFSYNKLNLKIKEAATEKFIVTVQNGGTIKYANSIYNLKSIELHSPSEHTVKEAVYPVEIHFVHKNKQGKTLIVAVFATTKMQNQTLDSVLQAIRSASKAFTLDASNLLPKTFDYYSYSGSLTSPPCTENVQWLVLKQPINISPAQLKEIGKIVGRNARLPQPVYMREVLEFSQ